MTVNVNVTIDEDKARRAQQCLADNGIDLDETSIVLQALGYILLDEELANVIDWDLK